MTVLRSRETESTGDEMSKGNNRRGNRETKKPKQPKKVAPATVAGFDKGVSPIAAIGAKKK